MGVKEFFKPGKGKFIVFVILMIISLCILFSSGCIIGLTGGIVCSWTDYLLPYFIPFFWFVPAALNELYVVIFMITAIIYWYILSCIITSLYNRLGDRIKKIVLIIFVLILVIFVSCGLIYGVYPIPELHEEAKTQCGLLFSGFCYKTSDTGCSNIPTTWDIELFKVNNEDKSCSDTDICGEWTTVCAPPDCIFNCG